MATNYLGGFYLTHLLLKQIADTPKSRIVQLTSLVEPNGGIEWSDIGYAPLGCPTTRMHTYSAASLAPD